MTTNNYCPHSIPKGHIDYIITVLTTLLKPHITINKTPEPCSTCAVYKISPRWAWPEHLCDENISHNIQFSDKTKMITITDPYAPPGEAAYYTREEPITWGRIILDRTPDNPNPGVGYPLKIQTCYARTTKNGLGEQLFNEIKFTYDPSNHDTFTKTLYEKIAQAGLIWIDKKHTKYTKKIIIANCKRPEYPLKPWEDVNQDKPMRPTVYAEKLRRAKLSIPGRKCAHKGCKWKAMPQSTGCIMHNQRAGRPSKSSTKPS